MTFSTISNSKHKDMKSWFHSSISFPSFFREGVPLVDACDRRRRQAFLGLTYPVSDSKRQAPFYRKSKDTRGTVVSLCEANGDLGTLGTIQKGHLPFRKATGFRRLLATRWHVRSPGGLGYGRTPRRFFQRATGMSFTLFEKKNASIGKPSEEDETRAQRIHRKNSRMEWNTRRGMNSGNTHILRKDLRKLYKRFEVGNKGRLARKDTPISSSFSVLNPMTLQPRRRKKERAKHLFLSSQITLQNILAQYMIQAHRGVEIYMSRQGRRLIPVAHPSLPRRSLKRTLRRRRNRRKKNSPANQASKSKMYDFYNEGILGARKSRGRLLQELQLRKTSRKKPWWPKKT